MLSGKSKGLEGKVIKVYRKKNQVLVEGVNMIFKTVQSDENLVRKKVVK